MSNVTIAFPNRIDGAALSGGAWQIPLTMLQNRLIARVARSASLDTADTMFDIAVDEERAIEAAVLVNTNFSLLAEYRLTAATSPAFDPGTIEYETGWLEAYPSVYSTAELEWRNPNFWSGRPRAEDIVGFTRSVVHIPPRPVYARYWRVEISDPENADGYVQIGRVFIGEAWQASANYVYGGSLAYESATTIAMARGGAEFFDRREPYRVMRFGFQYLPEQEALERGLDIQRRAGVSEEVFIVPDPEDAKNMTRRSFLGRIRTLSAWEQALYQRANLSFEIKELQ